MRHTTILTSTAIVVAALLSGCLSASGDKTGNPRPSATLVLANSDLRGLLGAPAVNYFVDQVEELSAGNLQISVESEWQGGNDEAQVIRDVADGKAALGWSGTRAFDLVGINAFAPLHAPFLVSTYPAEAAVVTEPVAGDMLGGLRPIGLTGLGLLADELRMPASAAAPVLTPRDFRGLVFGTFDSTIQSNALAALGADPRTMVKPDRPGIEGLDALETMWRTYDANSQRDLVPYVTRNVVLWPRTVAVFANTDALRQLTGDQRGWLTEAASRATAWSAEHAQDEEPRQVSHACASGARVATATSAQLSSLRDAAEPFYSTLRDDPELGRTMRRVESAVAGAPATPPPSTLPPGCAYRPGEPPLIGAQVDALAGPGRPGDLPAGTYRYSVSLDELRDHGLSLLDSLANAGVWTWTLGNGRWSYELKPSEEVPPGYAGNDCAGYYDVHGDRVDFTRVTEYPTGECAPNTWTGSWSPAGDALAMHHIIDYQLDYLFGGKRWERISAND